MRVRRRPSDQFSLFEQPATCSRPPRSATVTVAPAGVSTYRLRYAPSIPRFSLAPSRRPGCPTRVVLSAVDCRCKLWWAFPSVKPMQHQERTASCVKSAHHHSATASAKATRPRPPAVRRGQAQEYVLVAVSTGFHLRYLSLALRQPRAAQFRELLP